MAKLVESLSDNAPSRGVVPGWEDPSHRFLNGLGEVNLQDADGPATTIFELLVHGNSKKYLDLCPALYTFPIASRTHLHQPNFSLCLVHLLW